MILPVSDFSNQCHVVQQGTKCYNFSIGSVFLGQHQPFFVHIFDVLIPKIVMIMSFVLVYI